jgi:Flp pilus assembly protein TadG
MTHGSTHRHERGQALVETAIVLVMLVVLTLAIMEFGRAWMVLNVITHAASDGARAASLAPPALRGAGGVIVDATPIQDLVTSQIATVLDTSAITSIDVVQSDVGGVPVVSVTVNGSVPFLFTTVFADNFAVARTVTFRDEGR